MSMDNKYIKLSDKDVLSNLKIYNNEETKELCQEIREKLISTVSKTGGHLASNLGVVELTVAMHKVFSSPTDSFIFDVGHQCYTHKLLTGRYDVFDTLRQEDGISGFPKPEESVHDSFITGHSSTSISIACGFAAAKSLKKEDGKVLALIGDGAFTNGMVYEGLNNVNQIKNNNNLIIILNDNNMSISKNVGGIAKYLGRVRTKKSYIKAKTVTKKILDKIPLIGPPISRLVSRIKDSFKAKILQGTIFEDLGFFYIGPIDGHNIKSLENAFKMAKNVEDKPVFIQIVTVKGKGFTEAETNPGAFHGVSNVNLESPKASLPSDDSYSAVVGKHLVKLAELDDKICAVSAAMKYATGLNFFNDRFKDRFFDVGIAEGHGVTFTAALAKMGMKPVFAVYSTFLQRSYDQILHDAAINDVDMVLAIDRAGIVGDDGETHQGVFDVSFLSTIPNVKIFSPFNYSELEDTITKGIYDKKGVIAIRYPRGSELKITNDKFNDLFEVPKEYNDYTFFETNSKILVCTYGREFFEVASAFKGDFDILKLNNLSDFSKDLIEKSLEYDHVFFYEEGIENGGIGQIFLSNLSKMGYNGSYKHVAIKNHFVKQSSIERAIEKLNLDAKSISREVAGLTRVI